MTMPTSSPALTAASTSSASHAAGRSRQGVHVFADYHGDLHDRADVVVVGSGPGGAIVARELAAAGKDVILVEEGPPFSPSDFELDGGMSMTRTMREAGLRTTRGTVMPTMQAIALGGGSVVNSGICVRAPAAALDGWSEAFALRSSSLHDLEPHYDAVAELLSIAPTPDHVQGTRNLLFKRGCDALGYSSEPIARNVRDCHGSGECLTGCRHRAKQSLDITCVPDAIRHGARVYTSVQIQRVVGKHRRARAVVGRVVQPFTGTLSHHVVFEADVIVLAAGCLATPIILFKSGLANSSRQVGENLQFHPGVAITGVFDERVDPQFGATQGYQSLQFVDEGYKLETIWAPPGLIFVRLPGFGLALKQRVAEVPYSATWDAISSCHRSLGTVRPRLVGATMEPVLRWRLHPHDLPTLQRALWTLAELFFAAGARKIIPGVFGIPDEMHTLQEAREIRTKSLASTDVVCAGNHVFSTTRMHGDPRQGVVDETGRCHDLDNLYIADTGILPRSPSVNPMFTLMALAHRLACRVAARL